jgi:hypothetical protein
MPGSGAHVPNINAADAAMLILDQKIQDLENVSLRTVVVCS